MWGLMFRKCWGTFGRPWSLRNAGLLATAWKLWEHGDYRSLIEVHSAITLGWFGPRSYGPLMISTHSKCKVDPQNVVKVTGAYPFSWSWSPIFSLGEEVEDTER
jgi:hypothetical protein